MAKKHEKHSAPKKEREFPKDLKVVYYLTIAILILVALYFVGLFLKNSGVF